MRHRLVAACTSIPMPEIRAVNTSYQTWPWRYLRRTHIPGQEWAVVRRQMSPLELRTAYRKCRYDLSLFGAQYRCASFSPIHQLWAPDGMQVNASLLKIIY
jgi:hypothetical protein